MKKYVVRRYMHSKISDECLAILDYDQTEFRGLEACKQWVDDHIDETYDRIEVINGTGVCKAIKYIDGWR